MTGKDLEMGFYRSKGLRAAGSPLIKPDSLG